MYCTESLLPNLDKGTQIKKKIYVGALCYYANSMEVRLSFYLI
jgi:hypothetical protein